MTTPTLTTVSRRAAELARRFARTRTAQTVVAKAKPILLRVRRTWRRSLQLRMVTITVIASGILVSGFGSLVALRNNTALMRGAEEAAYQQTEKSADYLTADLADWPNGEAPDTGTHVISLLSDLMKSQEESDFYMVTFDHAPTSVSFPAAIWPKPNGGIGDFLSKQIRAEVSTGDRASQVVTVNGATYLVYGRPVFTPRWGDDYQQIELYYVTSLEAEVGVAEDFRVTIILVASALVLLLTVLVVLVTRLVAQPVRLAAQTAQRLSAGLLDERMIVKGEDELALLADAFNQMAANLQRQIVRLEEMSRLQRRFTSDVSHELRTPLTTVRMAADLLHSERESFDPAVARSAELLQTELDRFEELLTDLLEISRFDAGFAMLDGEPTELVALVRRAIERLRPVALRAGVEVTLVAPEPPVVAEIDARRVERILRNLIDNAIDHGQGRPIVVTLGSDGQAIAITVRDYGIGFNAGEEKLVFNRFWRADPSRARQTGGTGLGLSISVEDARLHGGWLEAWGEPGNGAQFRLTVPIRAGARLTGSPLPLQPAEIKLPTQPSAAQVPA